MEALAESAVPTSRIDRTSILQASILAVYQRGTLDYLLFSTQPSGIAVASEEVSRIARPGDVSVDRTIDLCEATAVHAFASKAGEERSPKGAEEQRLLVMRGGSLAVGVLVPSAIEVASFPKENFLPLPALLASRCNFTGLLMDNGAPKALVVNCAELRRAAMEQPAEAPAKQE